MLLLMALVLRFDDFCAASLFCSEVAAVEGRAGLAGAVVFGPAYQGFGLLAVAGLLVAVVGVTG